MCLGVGYIYIYTHLWIMLSSFWSFLSVTDGATLIPNQSNIVNHWVEHFNSSQSAINL